MTRREFLTWLVAAGGAVLAACTKDQTPARREEARTHGAGLDCSDVVMLSAVEVLTRTSNEYRQHSNRDDQFCLICLNYVPPPSPDRCGTCKTVKGPINPDGWCKQWTKSRS
jgi:hypothetical protein